MSDDPQIPDTTPEEKPTSKGADGAAPEASVESAGSLESAPASPEERADVAQSAEEENRAFSIVGIGASAGGLEALAELIANIEIDSMAYVVVQHLAPNHESMLRELLARSSNKMEVITVVDGVEVVPNRIYVIPPNADLSLSQGHLHVTPPPDGRRPHLAVDSFFRSLAEDWGARSIGVVLSGTGTDGTFGLEAIKAAGGITFVQDPSTAKYDGMPRSALDSGHADFCMSPKAIGLELQQIVRHPYMTRPAAIHGHTKDDFDALFGMLRAAFGNDFGYYKPTTIERRIERRMAVHKLERIADYVQLCRSKPSELAILYKDLLIRVTSFFRDYEPFQALQSKIFPELVARKKKNSAIRIWVPGCATGEEVFSIAICLLEFLDGATPDYSIQIFGTDIDEDSIQTARRGIYPQNIALDVSPERLRRFFVKKDDEYQISRSIRDVVVFSNQNITKDPPFSKLDLVSCRNLLIYLQPLMQKKVLRLIHYSLMPEGNLLLGNSETVGDSPDLFSLVDRKNKIYVAKHVAQIPDFDVGFAVPPGTRVPEVIRATDGGRPVLSLQQLADRKILEQHGMPGVVINENFEVLHYRGRTAAYLEAAPGAATFNLLRLARPELHTDLRRGVQAGLTSDLPLSIATTVKDDSGAFRPISIEIYPLQEPQTKTRCLLILFNDSGVPKKNLPIEPAASPDRRTQDLERELALTKTYLQTTIEELETSNEELKSSNEELQSSNEELQSANEELETSKEELQSTNEELTTVNDELQKRMSDLRLAHDDLHNILLGVDNAVVVVGMDLRIRRYTPPAERLLNLIVGDVGRPIASLRAFTRGLDLEQVAAQTIDSLVAAEIEFLGADDRYYKLRVLPYKTLEQSIRGAVLVFVDVDMKKRAGDLTGEIVRFLGNFMGALRTSNPLLALDARRRVLWMNEAFAQSFELAPHQVVGRPIEEVPSCAWAADPAFQSLLDSLPITMTPFRNFRAECALPVGKRAIHVSGSVLPSLGNEARLMLISIEDTAGQRL